MWHEEQFQFSSCRIQCSRTEGETETRIIACMFVDTQTHMYRHVQADTTSTVPLRAHTHTHTSVSCFIAAHCLIFFQDNLEVLYGIIRKKNTIHRNLRAYICVWKLLFSHNLLLHYTHSDFAVIAKGDMIEIIHLSTAKSESYDVIRHTCVDLQTIWVMKAGMQSNHHSQFYLRLLSVMKVC